MTTFLWLLAFAFYILPTLEALCRRKKNWGAIAALNLLLGRTVIGWIAALIWSMTNDSPSPRPSL